MKIIATLANTDNKTLICFETVLKLCIEYFCSSFKLEIAVQHNISLPNIYYKMNLRESLC